MPSPHRIGLTINKGMIHMQLTEGQKQAIASVNEFADKYFDEASIHQWCQSMGIPSYVYDAFYESPLGGYALSQNAGGYDCPFLDRVTMLTELTRRAGATLPFSSDMNSLAMFSTMRKLSQEEIVEEYSYTDGRIRFSQAFTEPNAGTDTQAVRTQISTDPDGIYLDGIKTFVSCGQFSPQTLVLARDPIYGQRDGGMSMWLIPIKLEGVSTFPINTIGQDMLCPAAISFKHVKLEPRWQIQTEGKLNSILKRQYGLGRILVCASSVGLALAAMDDAVAYASEHEVKGRRLNSLPQIQEKLTDMEIKIRAMRMFVRDAAVAADERGSNFMLETALMKRFVPGAATEVASQALQIFGGVGYTDATRVSRIWQDCRGNQIAQGTDEVMAGIAAKGITQRAESRGY